MSLPPDLERVLNNSMARAHEKLKSGSRVNGLFEYDRPFARIFIERNLQPSIVFIRDKHNRPLVPSALTHGEQFLVRGVCVYESTVYDPMVPTPMPLEQYLQTAFPQNECVTDDVFEGEKFWDYVRNY